MRQEIDISIDHKDPIALRHAIRLGEFRSHTTGLAPGYVQANIAILPKDYADAFLRFCQRNPKPCPLLAVSEPGDPHLPSLGKDLDIRTDVPSYRVFQEGEEVCDRHDITDIWQNDFVTFALGCSYSFEEAIGNSGVPQPYLEGDECVPCYVTNIDCTPANPFNGKLVVSMRSFRAADAIRVIQITSGFPAVHGAPVHMGDPNLIGIDNIDKPHFGPQPSIAQDEIPLFWACGVTPQIVVQNARPPVCITHTPAHMLVSDIPNSNMAFL